MPPPVVASADELADLMLASALSKVKAAEITGYTLLVYHGNDDMTITTTSCCLHHGAADMASDAAVLMERRIPCGEGGR